MAYAPFVTKNGNFKKIALADFWDLCCAVVRSDKCVTAVVQPIAKLMLSSLKSMSSFSHDGANYHVSLLPQLHVYVKHVFLDVCGTRLGLVPLREALPSISTDFSKGFGLAFAMTIEKAIGKSMLSGLDGSAAQILRGALLRANELAKIVTVDSKVNAVAPEPLVGKAPGPLPSVTAEPNGVLLVGAIVRTSSGNKKDRFDNQKARVEHVRPGATSLVKVLLQSGPCAGDVHESSRHNLVMWNDAAVGDVAAAGVVPNAGSKPPSDSMADKAARAAKLFGVPVP